MLVASTSAGFVLGCPQGLVAAVVGFVMACWLGSPSEFPPEPGRLVYRTEARVDDRGRVVLARRERAWLAVADPMSFEVATTAAADGGVLLVPVEDLARRLEAAGCR